MKIKTAEFLSSAPNPRFCPVSERLEFAFIGRSNVGKSSLINMLAGRKSLALVSSTPGKTKLINFFLINDTWCLVDLPGYGYAHVAKDKRADFNESVAAYLEHRENLKQIFILIDSRIPPQAIDLDFIQWVQERSLPFTLIFTKTDKLSPTKLQVQIEQFIGAFPNGSLGEPVILSCSSYANKGKQDILTRISLLLNAD